jgi:hypothetical protein
MIVTCLFTGQREAVDPIVSSGMPSEHAHQFYGAVGVTSTEDTASLLQKATMCVVETNHSGYWIGVPERDGVPLEPLNKHLLIYYRCVIRNCREASGIPVNTGLVAGNAHATSVAENPLFDNLELSGFRCRTGGGTFSATPPATCDSERLVIGVTFEPVGGVRLQAYFRFRLPSTRVGEITLGGKPSYTLHADFLFGHEQVAWDAFMDRCIRANEDCGTNPVLT